MIQITPVLKSIIFLWIYEEYCTCTDMLIIITVMSKQKYINDNVYQRSISSFSKQTSTRAYEHPGFILRLILDGTTIKFEPTFKEFEVIILNVYDVMIKASQQVPRVETKLYLDWVRIINYCDFFHIMWGRRRGHQRAL